MNREIILRVKRTLEIFIENNGEISDENLAKLLTFENIKSSSSTVGRDLTVNLKRLFSNNATEEQLKIIKFVEMKRKINKYNWNIKGGQNSAFNNDIIKDESGKFKGSLKRHG
ncbi:MAG: hypothetical protein J6J17_00955 [Bacilli bacterium]|nr:hypothetical protein [Bacilli bacterium]